MNDLLRVYCLALTLTTSACAWAQTSGPASPGRTSPAPAVPLDASPGIRRQFGSPDHFLAMVRQAYPAV